MKKIIFFLFFLYLPFLQAQIPAFPGAEGFGALSTTGGRGGTVIKVTNLNCSGPGSLNEALNTPGPKYIVFTVSGIIDCAAEVSWGDCYIAGQTSPGGITVRGILMDDYYDPTGSARNVILRHLNSRPGTEDIRPGTGWVMDDGLRLDGARNIVIDHCSFANATDECIQLSRSSNILIQNSTLAETLGPHYIYGGMLTNYSVEGHEKDSVSIHHNLWNRIGGRMPELSCEPSAESPGDMDCLNHPFRFEFSNNLLWDLPIQIYYEPTEDFFVEPNFVNNLAVARSGYGGAMFHHPLLDHPENELYADGNNMNLYPDYTDYELFYCCNDFNLYNPNTDLGTAVKRSSRFNYPAITYTPTTGLRADILEKSGAFNAFSPANRDSMNRRLFKFLQMNSIDPQPVNGIDYYHDAYLLDYTTAPAAPADSDNDGMPDSWETAHGLNPNLQDHNGTGLSVGLTGIAGYTNIECYLNQLSDMLTSSTITLAADLADFIAIPIAAEQQVILQWSAMADDDTEFIIERSLDNADYVKVGSRPAQETSQTAFYEMTDENVPAGQLYYRLSAIDQDGFKTLKTVAVYLSTPDEWVRIYQQVAEGKLVVEIMDAMDLPVEVVLIDIAGRIIMRTNIRNGNGELDVSDVQPGIYFLALSNGYLRHTVKVVIH